MCLYPAPPLQDDKTDVVVSRGHGEEGLLPAETEKSIHQLLLLSSRVAQMESLSQGFEFRGRQEIQRLGQILQVALCGSGKQSRNTANSTLVPARRI